MNTGQTERWMENIVSNTFYVDIIDRLTSSFFKLFINKTRRASTTRQDPPNPAKIAVTFETIMM